MGFVGPNGAGKTTTLRILAGIFPPSGGRASLGGVDLVRDPVGAKRRLGFVPDTPELFAHLTVAEHLELAGRLHGVEDRDARAERLLRELEIDDRRDHLPDSLSRGMRQKVAIAWAFLHAPDVLLLDEPLSGLDPIGIRTAKAAIRARADAGSAVIISSHQLELVEAMCDSILIIARGRALARAPIRELKDRVREDATLEDVFFQVTGGAGPESAPSEPPSELPSDPDAP